MRHRIRFGLVAFAVLSVTAAQAQITEYTTQAAFVAAIQGGFLNATTFGATGATLNIAGNGFSTAVTSSGGTVYSSGTLFGANLPGDVITFTMGGTNVTAFGGNFFASNINDAVQTDTNVTLTVTLNTAASLTTTGFANQFRGFTAPVGTTIASVVLQKGTSSTTEGRYATANNIFLGARLAGGATAPEPATGLLLVGVVGLVAVRRARRP
jgi:hypothetical protein